MFWDPLFERVAVLAGAPADQIKLIFALLISYPLASLYTRLPPARPHLAHLFSIFVSTMFFVPLLGLGTGMLHLLFACGVTYLIVLKMRGIRMPWVAFWFVMGHLIIAHIRRRAAHYPPGTIDITFSQMVLAMRLTMFAWNVHDGRQKAEELDEGQLTTRLVDMPGPLAFLGYCFFFPSVLIGPSFDYATYDSLVRHTIYQLPTPTDSTTKKDAQKREARRRLPYGRKRVAYLHSIIGLVFLGIYSVYGGRASYERILTPTWYTWSLASRFGFIQIAGLIARTKYYAVWSLSEGACIMTGVGFNGYDPKTGRTLWNRVRNINILSIETAESFKVLFDSWNCRTNIWLRDCVYKRLVKKGEKPGTMQSMATFVTSAFWHGIEPGYYLVFISAGILTSTGRQLRHFVRPYFTLPPSSTSATPTSSSTWPVSPKRSYDIIGWFMVQINLNYIASAFILLTFTDCVRAWSRMWWYSHIMVVLTMIFFQCGGRRALRSGLPAKSPRKAVPSFKLSPPSPIVPDPALHDELDSRDFRWVKQALDNPPHQDGSEGVTPDAGLVDGVVMGAETPLGEKSNPF